jgi:membrane protein required for colicin V production
MHYLDIIILVIIAASAIEGGIHGFVFEVFSLSGLLAGIFLALRYFSWLAGYLHFLSLPDWVLNVIAFLVILIVISMIFRLVGSALRSTLKKIFMGWLDHGVGVAFGVARGAVMVVLITMMLMLTPLRQVLLREEPHTAILKQSMRVVNPLLKTLTQDRVPIKDSI